MKEIKNTYQLWEAMIFFSFILTILITFFLMKYTWSFGTEWGTFEEHAQVWKVILLEAKHLKTSSYLQYKNFIIENDFLMDFFIHTGLPFLSSFIGSSIIIVKWLWVKGGIDKAMHISGARLYKNKLAIKHAKKRLKKELKNA
jgi:hypothetical protein